VPDLVGTADEVDPDSEVPCGGQRTIHRTPGRMIAAHGVNRDSHREPVRLLFVDGAHLAGTIVPAIGADAVGGLGLATLRAAAGRDGRQRIVRPALAATGLRMATFRIRHRRAFVR
jgi:hypothetical protein